jgi:hypothetical protein
MNNWFVDTSTNIDTRSCNVGQGSMVDQFLEYNAAYDPGKGESQTCTTFYMCVSLVEVPAGSLIAPGTPILRKKISGKHKLPDTAICWYTTHLCIWMLLQKILRGWLITKEFWSFRNWTTHFCSNLI